MNPHFSPPEHQNYPGVIRVNVPGLQFPVFTDRNLAEQLQHLIKSKKLEEARLMVEWLGGMDFQREAR